METSASDELDPCSYIKVVIPWPLSVLISTFLFMMIEEVPVALDSNCLAYLIIS